MGLIPIFFLFFCEINESNQLLHGSTAGMHSRKKMLVLKEVGVGFFIFYFYLFSVSIILDRVPHSNMPFLQVVGVYLSLLHHFLRLFSCSSSSNCLSATFLERSQKFARSAYNPSKCCWMKHSCSFYMGLWRDWIKEKPTEWSNFFKAKFLPLTKFGKIMDETPNSPLV